MNSIVHTPNWKSVISEHDVGKPVVILHCFTCHQNILIKSGAHEMSDADLDVLARKQGWHIEDGGINGKCPSCVISDK